MVSLDEIWVSREEAEQNRRTNPSPGRKKKAVQNIVQLEREIYTEREIDNPVVGANDETTIVKKSSDLDARIVDRLDILVDHILNEVTEAIGEGSGPSQAPYLTALNRWFDTAVKTRLLLRGQVTERAEISVKSGSKMITTERIKLIQRQLLEGIDHGDEDEDEEGFELEDSSGAGRIIEVSGRNVIDDSHSMGKSLAARRRERRDRKKR